MSGYVGERARRRQRSIFSIFLIFTIIIILFFFGPKLILNSHNISETENSLLPSEQEIISPKLSSTIEDLEIKVFDIQQKIIFRDKQILNLKNDLISSKNNNELLLQKNIQLNNKIKLKLNEIDPNIELNKIKISNKNIKNENKKLFKKIELLNDEIISYKKIINNLNKKNDDILDLNLKIENLENLIMEKDLIISILKDSSPHG